LRRVSNNEWGLRDDAPAIVARIKELRAQMKNDPDRAVLIILNERWERANTIRGRTKS
jgi:hypothetical protein